MEFTEEILKKSAPSVVNVVKRSVWWRNSHHVDESKGAEDFNSASFLLVIDPFIL